jgi:hypothetical protein
MWRIQDRLAGADDSGGTGPEDWIDRNLDFAGRPG